MFFKKRKLPEIRVGGIYRRTESGRGESAHVQSVDRDRLGIVHVRFILHPGPFVEAPMQGEHRTLSQDSFLKTFPVLTEAYPAGAE